MFDSDEKAKKFLIDLIGNGKYKELVNEGKIEINSGKFVYELYSNGNVVNKTLNQKYCIITSKDVISYPPSDILAIKWAWLNYGYKTVENVVRPSNRTDLNINLGLSDVRIEVATYNDFVHEMQNHGWYREQLRIDENNTNFVTTYSNTKIHGFNTSYIIEIICPSGRVMTTKGIRQLEVGEDRRNLHVLALYIKDVNGEEIDKMTQIRIEKIKPSEGVALIWTGVYGELSFTKDCEEINGHIMKNDNELFRWDRGVILYSGQILRITLVNYNHEINSKYIKIICDWDLWSRR